jgi:hypothetical protein
VDIHPLVGSININAPLISKLEAVVIQAELVKTILLNAPALLCGIVNTFAAALVCGP